MKKFFNIIAAVFCLTFLTRCGKENIEWIQPEHDYTVESIILKKTSTENSIPFLFRNGEKVSFVKHLTGFLGDGKFSVNRTDYYTGIAYTYDTYYDPYYGECYYSDWYGYEVTWSEESVTDYKFGWKWITQKELKLTFSETAKLRNSFWEKISGTYTVRKDTREEGTLYAEYIYLENDDVKIILKR